MPMNRSLYPKDWEAIARNIKNKSNWTCEQCGRLCRRPGESWQELEQRLGIAIHKKQQYTLTVAHLNHIPADCSESNLKAMCSVCHLQYDAIHHKESRIINRRQQMENLGQLSLIGE